MKSGQQIEELTNRIMELTRILNERGESERLTIADTALEFAGEAGEFCDAIKKMRRLQLGFRRKRNPPSITQARAMVEREAGNVLMCFLRLCNQLDIDPIECLSFKFNAIVLEEELFLPLITND